MFTEVLSALGLSSSAGLNAYIPLLSLSVAGTAGSLELNDSFRFLDSNVTVGVLVVLLIVEMVVDKVPALDSVNDVINTVIRPAAGGLSAAATTTGWWGEHWWSAALLGAAVALGVHGVKAVGRPAVNVTTAGMGGPVVSFVEDVAAVVLVIVALVLPILILAAMVLVGFGLWQARRRWTRPRRGQTAG